MKKGTAGQNVNRWFSYCSSQPEFKKVQEMVANNSQMGKNAVEKQNKPSSVCRILLFIYFEHSCDI